MVSVPVAGGVMGFSIWLADDPELPEFETTAETEV
jgi:hypothetical protein